MSLSKSKCCYSNNCLLFKVCCSTVANARCEPSKEIAQGRFKLAKKSTSTRVSNSGGHKLLNQNRASSGL
jgi:hypothetical protein